MRVQSLGWEDPLEEGMAALSSTLAWRVPWTEAREFPGAPFLLRGLHLNGPDLEHRFFSWAERSCCISNSKQRETTPNQIHSVRGGGRQKGDP